MTEDNIIAGVSELVAAGEYLDNLPGIPETGKRSGGVWYQKRGEKRLRRMYQRGSPEHIQARAAGLITPLPPLRPAPPDAVADAEETIGYALPRLLRRLYIEVANGGFGPGYGLLGIRGGHRDDSGKTAVDMYVDRRSANSVATLGEWPSSLFPLCYWGCAIYSMVDCATSDGRIWAWDPNPVPGDQLSRALFADATTLSAWLEAWLNGPLRQPGLVIDETSGALRPAVDADYAES